MYTKEEFDDIVKKSNCPKCSGNLKLMKTWITNDISYKIYECTVCHTKYYFDHWCGRLDCQDLETLKWYKFKLGAEQK